MLEGLAAWVLNNYVGKYVENLNTNQLSVGLLQGQVELEDLPLKKEAFRQLLFPLEIKNGYVGKILLNIPVTRLRSDPWVITVERLYVVLGPVPLEQYNGDLYEEVAQNNKLSKLDAFEAEWKNSRLHRQSSSSYYSYSYSSWLTYGSSLMTNIISSLQLKIQDIHIRYEDQIDGASFALGLMIKSAQSEHVQDEKSEAYVSQNLQLKGISIYWDVDALHIGDLEMSRMANSMENLRNFCVRSNETSCDHSLLLSANEGAQVMLSRNCSERPLRSRNEPRIRCNFHINTLPLVVTDVQYRQMIRSFQNIDNNHKHWKYRKWRPDVPVKGNCKAWWMFAVKAVTERHMKKRSCETIQYALEQAINLNRYTKIYHKHLLEAAISNDDADEKARIERGYDFETLLSLREIIMKKVDDQTNKCVPTENGEPQAGLLQYLFPGWSGWYSTSTKEPPSPTSSTYTNTYNDSETASMASTEVNSVPASQFEEELIAALNRLDDEHYLLRDATLAHVTFNLKSVTLSLHPGGRELCHLKVDDVSAQLKSHPRAKSYSIHTRVGCVQFVDKTLPNNVYSHLVAPHAISETQMNLRSGQKISASDLFRPRSAGNAAPLSASGSPLFQVMYERNPLGSTADHKLVINSQSLDIVYSPSTVQALKEFFTLKNQISMENAIQHLEHLKRETKTSLKSKMDAMLTGNQVVYRWDICLDICAPQIIMPESFTDRSSVAVMFDLGRLQFKNQGTFEKPKMERRRSSNEEDDDDDDFQTPCSTPPGGNTVVSEPKQQTGAAKKVSSPEFVEHSGAVSEVGFRDRMYDKYTLNLQDMQVMVTTCSRENWKFAQLRGSSHLHVIDRFNISLKFERRLLFTDDPQYPSVIVHAQLPKLVVHISDLKVSALSSCLRQLTGVDYQPEVAPEMTSHESGYVPLLKPNQDSVLFLGKFVIDQMSCELQSQGKCLAELQVHGVEMTYSKHPLMQSVQLLVQGLLLVDAIQTHGPDFDLLLASHKHITMDSKSGSIRDSEPNSPVSPASPKSYHCITPPSAEVAVFKPSMLTSILTSLHKTISPSSYESSSARSGMHYVPRGELSSPIPVFPGDPDNNNTDALIVVEVVWSQSRDQENDNSLVVHVGFNNLDVIANQETIVELVSFVQCIAQASKGRHEEILERKTVDGNSAFQASSINVNFDFHRLNILLLRSTSSDKATHPNLKLATATLSGAKIDAVLGEKVDLRVVLGGLQVCDLLSGDISKNHYVINVGVNPEDDVVTALGKQLYNTDCSALVLHIVREYPDTVDWSSTIKRTPGKGSNIKKNKNTLHMDLHLASVIYTHSTCLLEELAFCAIEFKTYVAKLASSLKTAAAEVAKGIVGSELPFQDELNVKLSVILETPVIVLPCEVCHPNVLVAHLGRITIRSLSPSSYKLELKNTSLYSLDAADPSSSYDCRENGRTILHNTQIDLFLNKVGQEGINMEQFALDEDKILDVWQLQGEVVGPLKVAVTKSQFAQILDTIAEISQSSPEAQEARQSKANDASAQLRYRAQFGIEEFIVEFCEEQGKAFASVAFQEFNLEMSRHTSQSLVNMSLHGLIMEDLYEEETSKHRILISSHQKAKPPPQPQTAIAAPIKSTFPMRFDYLSTSCPSFGTYAQDVPMGLGQSLPDILCTKNIFMMNFKKVPSRTRCRRSKDECTPTDQSAANCCCPQTPPPSPTPSLPTDTSAPPEGTLVEISVSTLYEATKTNRTINIDVNSLLVSINVRPWVMVLDLLSRPAYSPSQTIMKVGDATEPLGNTTLEMSVQNFTMQLNSRNYEICEAQVRQLWFKSVMSQTGSDIVGRLGKVLIYDLTPFGSKVYQERFVTSGNEAFHFKFTTSKNEQHRYNLECNMTSVLVVHTHLFLCEILNFIEEFSQVQELLARMQHHMIPEPQQKAKVDLTVTAGSPVIIIPRNSHSGDSLVLNLGSFTISTVFEQTLCLNQVMKLVLCEMDLYCGVFERESTLARRKHSDPLSSLFPSFNIHKKGASLLDEKFELQLKVMRNLDSETSHIEPDWSVEGHVSQATVSIDKEQYELLSGILFENLSEGVHLQTSSAGPVVNPVQDELSWVNLHIVLHLYNVTLNLMTDKTAGRGLAKVEFIKSKLSVSTSTNGRKDVDLESEQIRIFDIRYKNELERPNVFTDMLLPTQTSEGLQMQLNYRTFPNRMTVLLNNMRLMAIFDWFKQTAQFLALDPQNVSTSEATDSAEVFYRENPPENQEPMQLQLKLSMTDTEVVVVEDASSSDSNAVILKSTAVLNWHGKQQPQRPLICDLQNLEVFSCVLGTEEDTALSIIDPATISVEMNLKSPNSYELELSSNRLCIRLSYSDMKMFHKIIECLPHQAGPSTQTEISIAQLKELGFSQSDCVIALRICHGRIDDAALWLTQNAKTTTVKNRLMIWQLPVSLGSVQVADFRICFIDDCGDADVPLFEMRLHDTDTRLQLEQRSYEIKSSLRVDYYNRILSGWEPLVEPLVVKGIWRLTSMHIVEVETDGLLNINVTSALIDISNRVAASWKDDKEVATTRRRTPFVPFALKNSLGCKLQFASITTVPSVNHEASTVQPLRFNEVPSGATVKFSFSTQAKLRHQESHQLLIRQIVVQIEGCHPMEPISVDKVGEYFRYVRPCNSNLPTVGRVVFNISLEGSALKVINVKSAFVIKNFTNEAMDMNITTCRPTGALQKIGNQSMSMGGNSCTALPFAFDYTSIQVKPKNGDKLLFTDLGWKGATEAIPVIGVQRACAPLNKTQPYWYAVTIRREPFPSILFTEAEQLAPCHSLVLNAPVKLYNLLPLELHYRLEEPLSLFGVVKQRSSTTFHQISTDKNIVFEFLLDGFVCVNKLILEPGIGSNAFIIELRDVDQRSLMLRANVVVDHAAAYKIYISAPFWLINRTGLPLIFKQEGVSVESAGQPPEHEAARSVVPLLFSFVDNESPELCSMRLGSQLQSRFHPKWCHPFPLENGVGICKLFLSSTDNSPDRVYNIGIYGQQGKGVYKDTQYIVFSPLFLLVNNTPICLDFAQKFAAKGSHDSFITSAMPKSSVAFHWPRVDLDPLLCIRTEKSLWSGGFSIDKAMSSTHIHVRTLAMQSIFVLAEVRLHYGTYIVTFTQPETVPSPMRIENLSEVPVTFYQTGITEEARRYTVKAKTSMPYAWDEPTERPHISVAAPGGTCETYDMRTFKEGNKLYYENFFYIAFNGTFLEPRPAVAQKSARSIKSEELVLDVTHDSRVVINRKLTGSRSQLWRMTAERMLQHEGSSTPCYPRAPHSSHGRVFVLDVDGIAADPHTCVPLVLRKPDPRRRSLQTWTFTPDGRLRCDIFNLYVQSKGGLPGLHKGNTVVLGPENYYQSTEYLPRCRVPFHAGVGIQKMRGGSGVLDVCVVIDGPTIVLRVTDFTSSDAQLTANPLSRNLLSVYQAVEAAAAETPSTSTDVQIKVNLKQGLGLSFVENSEEILLITLHNVFLSFYQAEGCQSFDTTIKQLQVDNMLSDAERPCALYISPESRGDQHSHLPAVSITARRLVNYNTDTLVFDYLLISMKDTTLALEEKLMLKVFHMFHDFIPWLSDLDDNLIEQRSVAADVLRAYERKLYFNTLKVERHSVKLSVLPARTGTLDESLKQIKKQIGWSLIRFEDANVQLFAFERNHPFETLSFLLGTASAHYSNELKKQARTILGNVDFFGSPLGFIQDVKGGFKEMLNEKNPLTLFKSITHGASNSAAKFTGSLSEGLRNIANLDREAAVNPGTSTGSEQLLGGLRGFGKGIFDGAIGLIIHPYHGLTTNGIQGLVEGVGKGLMGSAALPAVGALDFATGMAAAIRDTSKIHERPDRQRPMRLCCGPRGLLPCYSPSLASGQMQLYKLNSKTGSSPTEMMLNEYFLNAHTLNGGMQLMVSDQRILKVSSRQHLLDVVHLCELSNAQLLITLNCVSLLLRLTDDETKRIDCGDSDEMNVQALEEMVQCINYAIYTFAEKRYAIQYVQDSE